MKKPKVSCIYCIENTTNNKKYIGQALDLDERYKEHTYELRSGTHFNKELQNEIVEFGPRNFEFYVLEYCKEDELDKKEIYWISYYDTFRNRTNGYNLTGGGSGKGKEKIEKQKRNKYETARDIIKHYPVGNSKDRKSFRRTLIISERFGLIGIKDINEFRYHMSEYLIEEFENNFSIFPRYEKPADWCYDDGDSDEYLYYCPDIFQINNLFGRMGIDLEIVEEENYFENELYSSWVFVPFYRNSEWK